MAELQSSRDSISMQLQHTKDELTEMQNKQASGFILMFSLTRFKNKHVNKSCNNQKLLRECIYPPSEF